MRKIEFSHPYHHKFLTTLFFCTVSLGILTGTPNRAGADEPSSYEKTLTEKQIESTQAGLQKYLRSMLPSEEQQQLFNRLIEQLGSTESFARREEATGLLISQPTPPTEALIKASEGDDPEVRWRAKEILTKAAPESRRVLYAAFRVIGKKKITGLTDDVLRSIPLCDQAYLVRAAQTAIALTAQSSDRASLEKATTAEETDVRIAAVRGLGAVLPEGEDQQLEALLKDESDHVKTAAARELANRGDRNVLQNLLALLSSEDVNVRNEASMILRNYTKQFFAYAPYADAEKRTAALEKWKTWVDGEGKTAKLHYPLKATGFGASFLNGNTLLAYGYSNKVEERDPNGKVIFTYTGHAAWGADKLANGNIILTSHNQHKIIEVDMQSKEVWNYSIQYPIAVRPLPNGNIMMVGYSPGRVVEVTRDKEIVWEYKGQGTIYDAQRLPNGNTVIGDRGGIVEVTPQQKIVWEYKTAQPYGLNLARNGNILASLSNGKVIEITRDKKIVWEYTDPGNTPCDAFRLENGNTLITGGSRFVEVTPEKKVVWSLNGCNYGNAKR